MPTSTDTDRIIPSNVLVRNRFFNTDQVCEIAVGEEEETYSIERLKEEREYFIGGNTSTLITLKDIPSRINIAEAYANVTRGLSLEWKCFTGNILLDWVTGCESEDLTRSISVGIEFPKKVAYTVDDRVECVESEEVKRFCKEHGLEKTIYSYSKIVCDVFKNVARITFSIASDPEIEEREKIKLNICLKEDIDTILKLDEELFKAIEDGISDKDKDYFVTTYEIIE
ncbi:MAG: hypothetical protein K8F52_04975 [Candidatus Scalindua rubra]|uniref:Uncharacterized protein n=1 Tax=Candidatus Scalindua brodae TaxID=237368 RepID=A0A0B0EQ19_9BACT|nr:MAG: hypothetical protein SCABRO_00315 [Candidatus Scalindua brodae]MBZ0108000.1 hypothetical protein [Candidatus Scalindua rubra]TWU28770.1 hypothetical protein S225a_27970 [Candidatus Brocadiaceae bacterium S225]